MLSGSKDVISQPGPGWMLQTGYRLISRVFTVPHFTYRRWHYLVRSTALYFLLILGIFGYYNIVNKDKGHTNGPVYEISNNGAVVVSKTCVGYEV